MIFAVVDFDGGGAACPSSSRDCDTPDEVAVGDRVEMTFRRLNAADGIANYFWKARPVEMSSHGIKDRVAIVGMGCTPFREHWDKGTDDLLIDAATETFASAGVAKDDIDAYWLGTAQSGMSGITAGRAAEAREQAGHPRRELLRDRVRGAAPGLLRRRVRRLRHRDGHRRREGEGLRLPGPQRVPDPQRRHQPHAHRRGHVQPRAARVRREVRRRHRRAAPHASPASRRRTTTTAPATPGRSSAGRWTSMPSARWPPSPASSR